MPTNRPARRRTRPTNEAEPVDVTFDDDGFDDDFDEVSQIRENRAARRRRARARGAASSKKIVIEEGQTEQIPIKLLGFEYETSPPKVSKFLAMAAEAELGGSTASSNIAQIEDWVLKAFGEDAGNEVLDRIDSDSDKLDYPHIQDLIQRTMALATKSPTM